MSIFWYLVSVGAWMGEFLTLCLCFLMCINVFPSCKGAEVRVVEEVSGCLPSNESDLASSERLSKQYGKNTHLWDRADSNPSSITESSLTQLLLDALQRLDNLAAVCRPSSVLAMLSAVQQVVKQCHRIPFPHCSTPCYRERVRFTVNRTFHYCTTCTKACQFFFLWILRFNHILMSLGYMLYKQSAFRHPVQHHHTNR